MLHADIWPEAGWLDVLLAECERIDAHMVAAVSPLKDARGLTSTAIERDQWSGRRLSFKELATLPETFGPQDVARFGGRLLVNSGCWIADLRKPEWFATDNGCLRHYFTIRNRVEWADGKAKISVESEDWSFSRGMADHGMRYFATRKVKLRHRGLADFPNFGEWGIETDNEVPHD
jgi:hypothetical protein